MNWCSVAVAASVVVGCAGTALGDVVAQFSFEGNLDDTATGGVVADNLSYNQGPSPNPAPQFVPGVPGVGGQAVLFDGNWFQAPDSADVSLVGDTWTLELFVHVSPAHNGQWERLIVKWGVSNDYHFAFETQDFNFFTGNPVGNVFDSNTGPVTDFTDGWHHLAITSSPAGYTAWIDGQVVSTGAAIVLADGTDPLGLGDFGIGGANNGLRHHGWMDEVLLHDSNVDQTYIDGRVALLAVPDPGGDPDMDDLNNQQEADLGTDPNDDDTDDDGIKDGDEVNGSDNIYTGMVNTGAPGDATDPRDDDSDDDGITDGDEVSGAGGFVTNPARFDTDGDGFGDLSEIEAGFDPTSAASAPESLVVSRWSFEDNLEDSASFGTTADDLTDNTSGVSYMPGVVGQAVAIPFAAGGTSKLTAASSVDLHLQGSWTLEAFVWRGVDNLQANEWERFWTKWEGATEWHWAFRGRDTELVPDGLDLFVNNTNVIDHDTTGQTLPFEEWVHVALVGDETAGTLRAFVNGAEVAEVAYVAIAPTAAAMNFGNFGGGDQSPLQFSGYIDEALIHQGAVSDAYLAGRARLLDPTPLEILDVQHSPGSGLATVRWTSKTGRFYSLDWSEDLDLWININDSIPGGDGVTSFDDITVPLNSTLRFYRVEELPQ